MIVNLAKVKADREAAEAARASDPAKDRRKNTEALIKQLSVELASPGFKEKRKSGIISEEREKALREQLEYYEMLLTKPKRKF